MNNKTYTKIPMQSRTIIKYRCTKTGRRAHFAYMPV